MENIVLGLLIIKSMTIYELNASFKSGLSMIYAASYGNLQYAIKKLLSKDMVTYNECVENGRNKKIYHITEKGRTAFFDWLSGDMSGRDIETEVLSKVFFLGLLENKKEQEKEIGIMQNAIDYYIKELETVKQNAHAQIIPEEFETVAKFQFSTIDYGLAVFQMTRNWLSNLK